MFTRKEQIIRKTGECGIGRYDFLRQLIHEFTTTTSYGKQILNLKNKSIF